MADVDHVDKKNLEKLLLLTVKGKQMFHLTRKMTDCRFGNESKRYYRGSIVKKRLLEMAAVFGYSAIGQHSCNKEK